MQERPKHPRKRTLLIGTGALMAAAFLAWRSGPIAPTREVTGVPSPSTAAAVTTNPPALAEKAAAETSLPPPAAQPGSLAELERPTIRPYTIQEGDTLWDVAARFTTDVDSILALNNVSDPTTIQIGTQLRVLPLVGTLHRVEPGESLSVIAALYEVDESEILRLNALPDPRLIQIDQELIVPGARRVMPRSRMVASGRGETARTRDTSRGMLWPVQGEITSEYGPRWGRLHAGIDIAANSGTPIRAAASGRVTSAGWDGSYGLAVVVEHANGLRTRYAHASVLRVKTGDRVESGATVADVGSTGFSTGPHLHFEVLEAGVRQDPMRYLP